MKKAVRWLGELYARHGTLINAFLVIALLYGGFALFGIGCPIKFLLGISCPGCGMTRAMLSAILLDFDSAFYYHPLWVALIPSLLLLVILKYKRREGLFLLSLVLMAVLLCAVYVVRLSSAQTDVVVFEPERGIFARLFEFLIKKFR